MTINVNICIFECFQCSALKSNSLSWQTLLGQPDKCVISFQIQVKFLAEEMQAISKGLEKVMQELSVSENDGPVSETFCKVC